MGYGYGFEGNWLLSGNMIVSDKIPGQKKGGNVAPFKQLRALQNGQTPQKRRGSLLPLVDPLGCQAAVIG